MTNMIEEIAHKITKIGYFETDHTQMIQMTFKFEGQIYQATEYVDMIKTVCVDDEGFVDYNGYAREDSNIDTWGIMINGHRYKEYKLGSGETEDDDVRDQQFKVFIIKQMKEFLATQEDDDLFDWDEEGAAA